MNDHTYQLTITWTGNKGQGTSHYKAYERNHSIEAAGKPVIPGSSDVAFLGNAYRYNPEELLVASLSACHMLWYLHLCAVNNIIITAYLDKATGTMQTNEKGSGRFTEVILHPQITISGNADTQRLNALHVEANSFCFIANSCNFPVRHKPVYTFI